MNFNKLLNLFKKNKNKSLYVNTWNSEISDSIYLIESNNSKKEDIRELKKPVEIFEEIISTSLEIDLTDLDNKIKSVKERIKILKTHLRNDNFVQEESALVYLKARKKYMKYKDLFKWATTNEELINKLCKKYKVRLVGIENYYRNVPKEGVDEIKKYGDAFNKVCDMNPEFKLIIDDGGKEQRKDPILLVSSPFGNWYYVLGAWDKEVEIIDKLIYERK